MSLCEALMHAGLRTRTRVNLNFIESQDLERHGSGRLDGVDAILVPGGFGERGIEGKIEAVRHARTHGIPYLGICLGMQLAIVEYARNVVGLAEAHSTEFNRGGPHPVIALISEWQDQKGTVESRDEKSEFGGTMRLGAQEVRISHGSLAHAVYGADVVRERHRHRYEFNNRYLQKMMNAGLRFSGFSRDGLVEIIELPAHPFFIASQYHPEFRSTPRDGHPLFTGFIRAARDFRAMQLPVAAGA
jgi:CTP synthase